MKTETIDPVQVMDALESLRGEVARLSQRTAELEKYLEAKASQPSARPEQAKVEGVSEELILAISAAVAAYLGVKPHIRQIRLLGGHPWGVQGRVTIQASHTLLLSHG